MQNWQNEILSEWERLQEKKEFQVTDSLRDRLAKEFKGEVAYREPMSRHTSMRVGGPADVYLKPQTVDDLIHLLRIAKEENIPVTFQGSGSNTLVKDGGIRGFVVCPPLSLRELRILSQDEKEAELEVGSGVKITRAVIESRDRSLTGLEPLVGIPGTIGGALVMNAGAHGTEIKDVISSITILEKEENIITQTREELHFEYRRLKIPRSSFVLSGVFRLKKMDPEEITKKIEHFQKWRGEKQPLNYPNLGSVFKNPPPPKKGEALSAGLLIEEAGLKNVRVGGARISEKHGNFIINENKATARDVLVLIHLVRDKIKESTGILLETEVKIIGED